MSIIDKLTTRAVKRADERPIKTTDNLFEGVYGKQEYTRQATTIRVVTDAEADRLLGQQLTEAQRAGVAAQVQLGR